ncbi:hypothetical protein [Aquimarina algicola]|nr:hypothetical protein [Aquimarina algicola]
MKDFIKDLTKELSLITPDTILWLSFITVALFSLFFAIGYDYAGAMH